MSADRNSLSLAEHQDAVHAVAVRLEAQIAERDATIAGLKHRVAELEAVAAEQQKSKQRRV